MSTCLVSASENLLCLDEPPDAARFLESLSFRLLLYCSKLVNLLQNYGLQFEHHRGTAQLYSSLSPMSASSVFPFPLLPAGLMYSVAVELVLLAGLVQMRQQLLLGELVPTLEVELVGELALETI